MTETLADQFQGCKALLPKALIDGAGWARLVACLSPLPAETHANSLGLEVRLGEPAAAADVVAVVKKDSNLIRHYCAAPPSWRAAAAPFATALREANVAYMLEYDLIDAPADADPPEVSGVFVDAADTAAALAAEAAALAGWRANAAEAAAVAAVLKALPEGAGLFQVGVMPPRSPRAVRLVMTVGGRDIAGFLRRIHWRGDHGAVLKAVGEWTGLTRNFTLGVAVNEKGVCDRLGLEITGRRPWHRIDRAGFLPHLAKLERAGLCLPDKAAALGEWPRLEWALTAERMLRVCLGINHFKLVFHKGGVSAKAYLVLYRANFADMDLE